jgi:hypothetical protein
MLTAAIIAATLALALPILTRFWARGGSPLRHPDLRNVGRTEDEDAAGFPVWVVGTLIASLLVIIFALLGERGWIIFFVPAVIGWMRKKKQQRLATEDHPDGIDFRK